MSNIKQFQTIFNVNQEDAVNNFCSKIPPPVPEPNKFTFPKKDDFEVLNSSSYKFTLDIDTLIQSSATSRRAIKYAKKGTGKPPRPQNAWVIYRRDVNARLTRDSAEYRNLRSSANKSKKIGEMWRKEHNNVKDLFHLLAKRAEEI